MSRRRGMFIAIEGIDAVGKKTQTFILKSWLDMRGLSTRTFSFPAYDTVVGREIRKFLAGTASYPQQARAMLYAANRWEKVAELEHLLSNNDALIVNRYTGSNYAYGTSNGLDLDWLVSLEAGLPRPDLTLVLDAPPTKIAPRRGERKDTYERNLELQEKVRGAYLTLAKKFGWAVVSAEGGIDETSRAVKAAVSKALDARHETV
jgi:dTMP kinase